METLSIDDLHNLNQGIQQIYALHHLDTFGMDVLEIVTRLVPNDLPVFHSTQIRTRKISSTFLPNFPGFSPELEQAADRYAQEHPITQHMPLTLNGAYKISDFVTEHQLHRLAGIYQQFLRPLNTEDQMFLFLLNPNPLSWVKLLQADANLVGIALHRPKRSFTERDRLILNLLRPHLFQAYSNLQKYQKSQQKCCQLQQSLDCLGTISLDCELQVKSIPPQAVIWLAIYFEPTNRDHPLPEHLRSWIKYQIDRLNQNSDFFNACLPLRIQQAGRELKIRLIVEPGRSGYLLLLKEQTQFSSVSLSLLELSLRETEVLALVIQGKDNKFIAAKLSINISTVRKHLEHIYNRWGVESRTEAIAQALAKLGIL
jgi:DNA-binding CsgD family transcriptional regulator